VSKLSACLTLLAVLSATPPAAGSPAAHGAVSAPAADIPLADFRLGSAARPFGWSTVISDFNADGAPDLAVADRGARRPWGFGYNVRVEVSGLSLRDIAFVSPHEAITVRAIDVDRDHDVDLVISAAPSGELVAIWLNDGRGRFTEGRVDQFPAQWSRDGRLDRGDSADGPGMSADGPPRTSEHLALPRTRAPSRSTRTLPITESPRRHIRSVSSSTGPRGPPLPAPSTSA
jgi:hypothetical protein